MTASEPRVSVGRVGKAHGLDGSFYVVSPSHPLPKGLSLTVAGNAVRIERRGGTDDRPLVRITGIADRNAAAKLVGEPLMASLSDAPLESDEWLAADLVGCEVAGVGKVLRVVEGPSCDVLEVGPDAVLIPFISDAVKHIDVEARRIEVDRDFLRLDEPTDRER